MSKSGKGSIWERELCGILSLWYTDGENDSVMWRTAMSGGRATIRSRSGKSSEGQHGDIQATDPIANPLFQRVTIEAKKGYGGLDILKCLDGTQGPGKHLLEVWIAQARLSSDNASVPYFWIVFKRDRHRASIAVDRKQYSALVASHGQPDAERLLCSIKPEPICLMRLEDFLLWVSPSFFGRD